MDLDLPTSCLLTLLLFTGSPGHAGSTSMSPSAALSTGKPMDSHSSYTNTPVSVPRTLSAVGTPLNALGSPYRVITSAMGPPSGALAAPPGMNLVAPPSSQVGAPPLLSHTAAYCVLYKGLDVAADCLLQGLQSEQPQETATKGGCLSGFNA